MFQSSVYVALFLALAPPEEESADPAPDPEATPTEPAIVEAPAPSHAVPDETWDALGDREVIVVDNVGEMRGKVLGRTPDTITLALDDGNVVTIDRAQISAVRIAEPAPPVVETPPPEEEPPPPSITEPTPSPIVTESEPTPPPRAVRLAAFVTQGPGFGFWTARGLTGKTVAYRLDGAFGIDVRERLGAYAVAGGLLGGRIDDDVRATFGHVGAAVMPHGPRFGAQMGLGLAFSRLASTHDRADRFEDLGLYVPMRMLGIIRLPKHFYIGIGASYGFAALRGFKILYNMVALELTVGRW